ncbi:MAG: hypothetical protein NT004_06265 [Bacteroidetes bacterium]|nr:hypothetical protein [Bacteroidota bacterium]
MRKQFYLDLVERLKGIVLVSDGAVETPLIKHFDLWNKQLEFLQKERPFNFPAVFVEFGQLEYRQLGLQAQEADLTVRLHIVSKTLTGSADSAVYQHTFLSHLDLIDTIHYCLACWNTDYSGPMIRIQGIPNHDHEQIIEEIEVYKLKITDMSGVRRVLEVKATPQFTANLHGRQ